MDAGHGARCRGVDRANPGMGVRTAHEAGVQRPGQHMSSTKRPRPVSSAGSSRRATRAPKCFAPMANVPAAQREATIHRKDCLAIGSDRTLQRRAQRLSRDARRAPDANAMPPARMPRGRRSISSRTSPRSRRAACLLRIERAINKDTELHPLVRWQFQGGLREEKRRAFLFTNVVDARGPSLRHSGCGRRARRIPANLCRRHGPPGRRDRGGVGVGHR